MNRLAPLLAVLLLAACGSSGAASPSRTPATLSSAGQPTAGQPTAVQPSAGGQPTIAPTATEPVANSSESADAGGSPIVVSGMPPIPDGTWTKGQAHVEVTGARTATVDMVGSMFATQGVLIGTLADAATASALHLLFASAEASGLALTAPDVITSADLGRDCTVKVTRMETAGMAGEITCQNLEAINRAGTETMRVNVHLTFSASP
jgi:hypothetical protein